MTKVNLDDIKALRVATGAPIGDCRTALQESDGDATKAKDLLRKRGVATAASDS